jgi:SAM-dependent methyltransferase
LSRPVVPAQDHEPTGERFEPEYMHGQIMEAEHLSRYAWAAQFAAGRRVLDAACGAAYGSAMLVAAGAREVVGIDVEEDVVAAAREKVTSGARFDVGDLRELPYEDDEFDLITCFEAIEHVAETELVLDELRRVLRPEGLLVLSTPNRDVYTPGNPFHLRELTPNELEAELGRRFGSVALYRQHTWAASGVFTDDEFALGDAAVVPDAELRKAFADAPGEETFTIGLASDGKLPDAHPLVTLSADADLRSWSERLEHGSQVAAAAAQEGEAAAAAKVDLMRREIAALRAQLAESETALARLAEVESQLAAVLPAMQEQEALARQHREVVNSLSWRITRPLRKLLSQLRR